jgi:hypothetical protein
VALPVSHARSDHVRRGQYDKASTVCTRLLAITPHQGSALSEHIDTCHRLASLYLAVGDLTRAKHLLAQLLDLCASRGLELQSVNLLVTLADVHLARVTIALNWSAIT